MIVAPAAVRLGPERRRVRETSPPESAMSERDARPPSVADGGTSAYRPDDPPTDGPGTVIGPYKLLRPIGEGGMGAVHMAEQEQPVRRVALKVIKPGMDSKQVIARFEAE